MNVVDVSRRIAAIEKAGSEGDDETAHSEEDRLYREVLAEIAEGHPDARLLAKTALQTQDVDFARWYA